MKRYYFLSVLAVYLSVSSVAQNIQVEQSIVRIVETKCMGARAEIRGDIKDIGAALRKDLREMGKVRDRNTYLHITEASIGGEFFETLNFYAQLKEGDNSHMIWFGVDDTDIDGDTRDFLMAELEKKTYHFVLGFYKDQAQASVEEAEGAEEFTERTIKRLEREAGSLKNQMEANEKELIRLEQALEANKLEHLLLEQKIEDNRIAREEASNSLEKLKEVTEERRKKKEAIH